jgi:hypothetical protein
VSEAQRYLDTQTGLHGEYAPDFAVFFPQLELAPEGDAAPVEEDVASGDEIPKNNT